MANRTWTDLSAILAAALQTGDKLLVKVFGGSGTTAEKTIQIDEFADGITPLLDYDVDGTLAANSDTKLPSQKAVKTYADTKVTKNSNITAGTKTKVTYDVKGLVTAGADATTADIADSADRRYCTDAQKTVIGNTSGTNTGDQDLSTLVPKTTTVNGHALSSNVTVTKSDVSLGNVNDVAQLPLSYLDTDVTLAANSDTKVPSQKAIKAYADGLIAANDAMTLEGVIDCSANPNYPAADAGHVYRVSVTGKIGGGSGPDVTAGDLLLCRVDATSAGNHATVGTSWTVIPINLTGGVTGPGSATDGNIVLFDGTTGDLIKNSAYSPASFVGANAGITGGTKTKITYDAKGLVTAGADATTADIADSTNKRYVTDAQLTVISNTSGTNTGDQTTISGNAGTATTLQTARNIDGVSFNGSADITVIAPGTNAASSKATPVDADEIPLVDSAASNVLKKLTWANLKATAKTHFDTLYATVAHNQSATTITSGILDPARLQPMRRKNLNGDMRIDQQFAGAASNSMATLTYPVDQACYITTQSGKFNGGRNLGSGTAPAGFPNYLGVVSTSSFSGAVSDTFSLYFDMEGYDVSDLAWGSADAKTCTFGFWAYNSQTGTFGASIQNSAKNRSYPFSYTINSANTWEFKTVTVPGDTSGTWLTTNGIGISIQLDLGCGSNFAGTANTWASADYRTVSGAVKTVATNAAVYRVTGLQFEEGSLASSYERRTISSELLQLQRYYAKSYLLGTAVGTSPGTGGNASLKYGHPTAFSYTNIQLPVRMRAAPTVSIYDSVGTVGKVSYFTGSWNNNGAISFTSATEAHIYMDASIASAYITNIDYVANARMQ